MAGSICHLLLCGRWGTEVQILSRDLFVHLQDVIHSRLKMRCGVIAFGDVTVVNLRVVVRLKNVAHVDVFYINRAQQCKTDFDFRFWVGRFDGGAHKSDVLSFGRHVMCVRSAKDVNLRKSISKLQRKILILENIRTSVLRPI